jgi:hypothetical protein
VQKQGVDEKDIANKISCAFKANGFSAKTSQSTNAVMVLMKTAIKIIPVSSAKQISTFSAKAADGIVWARISSTFFADIISRSFRRLANRI